MPQRKAAVNRAQSKRSAKFEDARQSRSVWTAVAERSDDTALGFVGAAVTRLILSEKSETPYVVSYWNKKRRGASLPAALQNKKPARVSGL
jgi:hypothetical protein